LGDIAPCVGLNFKHRLGIRWSDTGIQTHALRAEAVEQSTGVVVILLLITDDALARDLVPGLWTHNAMRCCGEKITRFIWHAFDALLDALFH
jgi:hypothetical protein